MNRFLLLLVLLLPVIPQNVFANHFTGAELRYEYIGAPNVYRLTLTLYKTCESGAIDFPSFMSITAECKSPNLFVNKNLGRTKTDTLKPFCPTTVTSCQNLTSVYPGYLIAVYSDTLRIPNQGTNWNLVLSNSSRNFGITNLRGASGQSYYIDAPLKLADLNTSAIIPDFPPHALFTNDSISVPLSATDKDGDSVAFKFVAPVFASNSPIPYDNGYSVSQPFGPTGLCYIDSNNNMVLKSTTSGKFTITLVAEEYRNGIRVGYVMRDFIIICQTKSTNDELSVPVPLSWKNLQTFTCPGKQNSLILDFKDPSPADSVYIDIEKPNIPGWSFNITQQNDQGRAKATINWTTPASANPSSIRQVEFKVTVRDNACQLRAKATYIYRVKLRNCDADSVWPGDANADKIADLYDPLAIALAYGNTGAPRPNPSINWVAQSGMYWDSTFLNNIDTKHADCNGDGIVDTADLQAVKANYGLIHARGSYKTTAARDLFFDHTGIKPNPDSTVTIKLTLGYGHLITDIYGLATNISIDGLPLATAPEIVHTPNWLGNDTNTLMFKHDISTTSIDWAYARTNKTNTSGQGVLANLVFKIPPETPNGTLVTLRYNRTLLIDNQGNALTNYGILEDTFYVWHLPTGVIDINQSLNNIEVYPNPGNYDLNISYHAATSQNVSFSVTDITGKQVIQHREEVQKGSNVTTIKTGTIPLGIYLVTVKTADGSYAQTVKWIKK